MVADGAEMLQARIHSVVRMVPTQRIQADRGAKAGEPGGQRSKDGPGF